MTVLDAYAVIAYLRGEDAASEVAEMLRGDAMLSAANAAEVVDQLVRIWGRDGDDVEGDLALLGHAGMWIHPLDAELALHAGRLRARHYHRKDCAGRRVGTSPACPTALVGDPDEPHRVRGRQGSAVPWGHDQRVRCQRDGSVVLVPQGAIMVMVRSGTCAAGVEAVVPVVARQ